MRFSYSLLNTQEEETSNMEHSFRQGNKRHIIFLVGVTLVALAVGVLIGYFSNSPPKDPYAKDQFQRETKTIQRAMDEVDVVWIRQYLQTLSGVPHLAGLDRDVDLTYWIKQGRTSFVQYMSKIQYCFNRSRLFVTIQNFSLSKIC